MGREADSIIKFEPKTMCPFCKRREATRLCDAPTARVRFCGHPPRAEMREYGHFISSLEELALCSRMICDECATEIAPEVDFCPHCMDRILKKYHARNKA